MAKWNKPEDVDNAVKNFTLPEDHYCWDCPWAYAMQDRFVCPFVSGSCARFPQTLTEPDEEFVRTAIRNKIKPRIRDRKKGKG